MTTTVQIRDLFAKIREFSDSRVVFVDGTGRTDISFGELAQLVDRKRATLAASKLSPRSRVGLLGANSLDWMAWDIAILHENHVPMAFTDEHVSTPPSELMERYGCALFVSDRPSDPASGCLPMRGEAAAATPRPVPSNVDGPDVLTLVFSSGTTGRTKGLVMTRSGIEHILAQFMEAYRLTREDKYYSFLPFSYFQQRGLYYASLYLGIDTVIVPPEQFLKHFSTEAPTYTINPPVFYEAIYNYVRSRERLGHAVSLKAVLGGKIRWMITAMAPIRREVLDYFWSAGVGLYETYGVTETGLVAWNTLADYKVGTVGKPAADGELILGEENQVLIRRQKPLSSGYFDVASEEASDVFRPDGTVTTGDIASIDADGYVTLVGRTKSAIITPQGKKFHPEQLEAEIESRLKEWVPVVVGGAGVCPNTLLLAPANEAASAKRSEVDFFACIRQVNEGSEAHKQIQALCVLDKPLSVASGLLTRNFKLERSNIAKAFLGGKLGQAEPLAKATREPRRLDQPATDPTA
jgi:long-chain acyl-CoA synthetase